MWQLLFCDVLAEHAWLGLFAQPFEARLSPEERPGYLDEVTALLKPVLCDEQGRWTADYVRLRFATRKP